MPYSKKKTSTKKNAASAVKCIQDLNVAAKNNGN